MHFYGQDILWMVQDGTFMDKTFYGQDILWMVQDGTFMDKTFFGWYKSQFCSFKAKCIFIHNNAISHVSKTKPWII